MEKQLISTAEVAYYALDELTPDERQLVLAARNATAVSHSPYSEYRVGCAVRLADGHIVTGANQENASYGLACCAERTTLFSVNNMGRKKDVRFIAVTARPANAPHPYVGDMPTAPCGACRQVIKESEDLAGKPITILMDCYDDQRIAKVESISALLPFAFGPANLGITL